MSDHVGRRRKPVRVPVIRLIVLAVALFAVGRLLTLQEPARTPAPQDSPLSVRPDRQGVVAVGQPAVLTDGTGYQPKIYLTPDTSLGIAPSPDGRSLRLLRRVAGGRVNEVRRLSVTDHPQFDGFVASGDVVVWAESTSRSSDAVRTTLWRTAWRTTAHPTQITSNTGDVNFYGSQYDLAVHAGRVYWVAVGAGTASSTEVRSVPLNGGTVATQRLTGEFALSAWPWAVSVGGGRGVPVQLVNLSSRARVKIATSAAEVATCSPQWCVIGVLGNNTLVRIDVQRPDGTQRQRVAGNDATPTVRDAALLDRFIPLTTDRGDGPTASGVDLTVYDISTATTALIATDVSSVQARAGMLWWSAGTGENRAWYAIDLRAVA